jgi:hypothetical protein
VYTSIYGGGTFEDEQVDVFVNGEYAGRTTDWGCNDGFVCRDCNSYYDVFQNVPVHGGENEVKFVFVDGSVAVWSYEVFCGEDGEIPEFAFWGAAIAVIGGVALVVFGRRKTRF